MKKVQIIEDDENIRLIARIALARSFRVVSSSSGAEGVMQAQNEQPDLILLDVRMPNIDGRETLTLLKSNPITNSIPVIFLTASVQSEELSDLKKLSVIGVLQKPFDPMTLPLEVETLYSGIRQGAAGFEAKDLR